MVAVSAAAGSPAYSESGGYAIYSFAGPGSLTFSEGGEVDYLVVGAGASGGWGRGGGGGAGALLQGKTTVVAGTVAISVGTGGAGLSAAGVGNDGGSSAFGTLIAPGGGGGGTNVSNAAVPGRPGGSGGGGGGGDLALGDPSGGASTGGGSPGGGGFRSATSAERAGGGGGGAAGAGGAASLARGGDGGAGLESSITGAAVIYAAGGRGFGTTSGAVPSGAANPGSGGRGGHTGQNSGAGINGIVIVRFALGGSGGGSLGIDRPRLSATGTSPLAGTALSPPSGWSGIAPGFAILRNGVRSYLHRFDPLAEMAPADITYFCAPHGSDLNSGLHPGLPKRSVNALVTALNAAPPAAGATIVLAPGVYGPGDALTTNVGFPCNLVCEEGKAQFYGTSASAWEKVAGLSNVYDSGPSSGARAQAIDLATLDTDGRPRRLRQVASAAACDALPGSVFVDLASTKIHVFGSRVPDAAVLRLAGSTQWVQTSPVRIYVRNVDFWGSAGRPVTWAPSGANGRICFDRCSFRYSALTENGVEVPSGDPSNRIVFYRCDASYNSYDGFSYRGSVTGWEIECRAEWNGFSQANGSDNGSTAHGAARTLRLNGLYARNDDRNVHDIDDTRNWLIGCTVGQAQNGLSDGYLNGNVLAGRQAQPDATRTWMDGCVSLGGSASDIGVYGNSVVTSVDGQGFTLVSVDAAGQFLPSQRDDGRSASGQLSVAAPAVQASGSTSVESVSGAGSLAIGLPAVSGTGTATFPDLRGVGTVAIGGPEVGGTTLRLSSRREALVGQSRNGGRLIGS